MRVGCVASTVAAGSVSSSLELSESSTSSEIEFDGEAAGSLVRGRLRDDEDRSIELVDDFASIAEENAGVEALDAKAAATAAAEAGGGAG